METVLKGLAIGVAFLALIVILAAIGSIFTLWAWNTTMPVIFKLPQIDIIQAFALNLLSGMIIKSSASHTK